MNGRMATYILFFALAVAWLPESATAALAGYYRINNVIYVPA